MPQALCRDYHHFYSRSFPYQSGTPVPVDLEFLRPALRLRRPVLDKVKLRIDFSVTVGATDTARGYLSELFGAVQLTDAHGERINWSDGAMMYIAEQLERGLTKVNGPDLVNGGVRTGTFYLTLFDGSPRKSARKGDYGIPLRELIDVGRLTMNWSNRTTLGGATNITAVGAATTVTMVAFVREEIMADNEVELKARHVWKDFGLAQRDFSYAINGSPRWIVNFGGFDAGGAFQLPGFTTIISSELQYRAIPITDLIEQYLEESWSGFPAAALDSLYDVVYQGFVQPFVWSKLEQKIATLPVIEGGCQLQFDANPTLANTPRVIVCSIMERSAQAAAAVMGAPSAAAAASALRAGAKVRGLLGTDDKPATSVNREVVARLPLRVELPTRK